MEFSAEMIAGYLGGEIAGDPQAKVSTFAKIEEGKPGALSFLSNPKYEPFIYKTKSSVVIVAKTFEPTAPVAATLVKVDDPYGSFAKLLELYDANRPRPTGISSLSAVDASTTLPEDAYVGEFAVIGKSVQIGAGVKLYPQVYIGDNVKLGDNVTVEYGAKIYEGCVLGNNVVVHAGAVIGCDGFGFAPDDKGEYHKIPQLGIVILEDNVDIGANTCVDRATMGATLIKRGAKLDNQVQIGHNSVVGRNTVAAAQFGLAGSSKLGDNCMIGGQAGVAGHLTVGNNVKLGSKTGITNDIPDNETVLGYPGMTGIKFHRSFAIYRNLPDLSAKVHKLEKEIARLTALLGDKSEE